MKENTEQIAKTCHEVNRAWCNQNGDFTQPVWELAPIWQQQSAINGVLYHQSHPESTPADSHESWMKEKLDDGWVYGEVKDAEKKTHPCIVPHSELPGVDQIKDVLFLAVVRSFD